MSAAAASGDAAEAKGGKKKLIIIAVVVLVVLGAAYKFVLAPKPAAGKEPPPEPGPVVALDPIQVNLAAGHYLSLGMALQLTAATKEADGSKALDAAIELFSGQPMAELADKEHRLQLKKELVKELKESYEGEVMGVYFTTFVTQ